MLLTLSVSCLIDSWSPANCFMICTHSDSMTCSTDLQPNLMTLFKTSGQLSLSRRQHLVIKTGVDPDAGINASLTWTLMELNLTRVDFSALQWYADLPLTSKCNVTSSYFSCQFITIQCSMFQLHIHSPILLLQRSAWQVYYLIVPFCSLQLIKHFHMLCNPHYS